MTRRPILLLVNPTAGGKPGSGPSLADDPERLRPEALVAGLRERGIEVRLHVLGGDDERSVELVAEGPSPALAQLERLLEAGPSGARVDSVEAHRGPVSGEFERFGIVRS